MLEWDGVSAELAKVLTISQEPDSTWIEQMWSSFANWSPQLPKASKNQCAAIQAPSWFLMIEKLHRIWHLLGQYPEKQTDFSISITAKLVVAKNKGHGTWERRRGTSYKN